MKIKKELNGKNFELKCEQSFFNCFMEVKIYEVMKWKCFTLKELKAEKAFSIDAWDSLHNAVDAIWFDYVEQLENEKIRKEKIKNFEKSLDNDNC